MTMQNCNSYFLQDVVKYCVGASETATTAATAATAAATTTTATSATANAT